MCKQEGITGYPMLYYYGGKGAGKTEYTGGRKFEQLKAFADKVSGPYVSRSVNQKARAHFSCSGVQELKYGELESRVAEQPVLYLFLHSPSDKALFVRAPAATDGLRLTIPTEAGRRGCKCTVRFTAAVHVFVVLVL